jgi:DNA-binding transcriptional regulator GbsR (MarR family)
MSQNLQQLRDRFVETGGNITQSIGIGRVIGQIFAHIYFSPDPQTLDDLTAALHISKGSASMSVRQLEQWGAVKQVWIKGERKDHYEANEDFGRIIRRALLDLIGRRMETADLLLRDGEEMVDHKKNGKGDHEHQFVRQRIQRLRIFRDRAQYIWDSSVLRLLLK